MPNWCSTLYVIEGNKDELTELYDIFKRLENSEKPTIYNGFEGTWLGCLVNALGGDWHNVRCRGIFDRVRWEDGHLEVFTYTAWIECGEVFKLAQRKFPSLKIYYSASEDGCGYYRTNDADGKYFGGRFRLDLNSIETGNTLENFDTKEEVYKYLSRMFKRDITCNKDVEELDKMVRKQLPWFGRCELVEFELDEWN